MPRTRSRRHGNSKWEGGFRAEVPDNALPHLPFLSPSQLASAICSRAYLLRRRVLYHLEPRAKNSISNSFKKNLRAPGKGWKAPRGEQEDIAAFLRYIMSCEISRRSPSAVRYRPQEIYSSNLLPTLGRLCENSDLKKKRIENFFLRSDWKSGDFIAFWWKNLHTFQICNLYRLITRSLIFHEQNAYAEDGNI